MAATPPLRGLREGEECRSAPLSEEHHQELEQVHEVEIKAERAEDRDLLGDVAAPGLGILVLDPLGVCLLYTSDAADE